MVRPPRHTAIATPEPGAPESGTPATLEAIGTPARTPAAAAALGSLADLPVAGLTRRRVALLLGAVLAAWVLLLFARQVGEAGEATARAAAMQTENGRLEAEAAALEAELALITRQAYIEQAARAFRLGKPREIPFTLDENAPPLPADAPGSASVRLGTPTARMTPSEAWLLLLFGAGDARDREVAPETPGTN